MNPLIEKFFKETRSAFEFLETDYNYFVNEKQENMDCFPDAIVSVNYANSLVEVKVFWHFASATISVAFTFRGKIEESKLLFSRIIPTININTLLQSRSPEGSEAKSLKITNGVTFSKIKKREKMINDDMKGEIAKQALLVKKYAMDIIEGDTSAFVISGR